MTTKRVRFRYECRDCCNKTGKRCKVLQYPQLLGEGFLTPDGMCKLYNVQTEPDIPEKPRVCKVCGTTDYMMPDRNWCKSCFNAHSNARKKARVAV